MRDEFETAELRSFVDGVLIGTVQDLQRRQLQYLIFDSETMPQWFGMPCDEDLPSTFSIEYVRAGKKTEWGGQGLAR